MNPARRALFSLVPILGLLLLGECGARLVGGPECASIAPQATGWETMQASKRYLWSLEPNRLFESPAGTSLTNSVGLRSSLLPASPRAANEKWVMVTGDSSVYGWGQPDGQTYAEQLERMLGEAFVGIPFRVVNLGVPGYSTEQTLRLMEDLGWSYEPDLLVVHNIFSDCNIDAFQDRSALALTDPAPSLLHHSRLYCACYMPWARYQSSLNQETNRVLMPGQPTGANQARRLEELDQWIDLSRVPLDDYLANLGKLHRQAETRSAGMILAPLAQEWDVGRWTAPMAPPIEGQVLPWAPYREAQQAWAEQRGLLRLDLPGAFASSGVDGNQLFIDSMHPSVVGAWIMAATVTRALRAHPESVGLTAAQVHPNWSPGPRPRNPFSAPEGPPPVGPPPGHSAPPSPHR